MHRFPLCYLGNGIRAVFWANNVLNYVAKVKPVDVEVLLLLHGDVKFMEGCPVIVLLFTGV